MSLEINKYSLSVISCLVLLGSPKQAVAQLKGERDLAFPEVNSLISQKIRAGQSLFWFTGHCDHDIKEIVFKKYKNWLIEDIDHSAYWEKLFSKKGLKDSLDDKIVVPKTFTGTIKEFNRTHHFHLRFGIDFQRTRSFVQPSKVLGEEISVPAGSYLARDLLIRFAESVESPLIEVHYGSPKYYLSKFGSTDKPKEITEDFVPAKIFFWTKDWKKP